jgi:uncharacterized membrane protein YdjX (TVP38/TMEM64 family)
MAEPTSPLSWPQKILRGILLILVLSAFVFVLRWISNAGLLKRALDWIGELGPWGPVAFIIIYIVAVVLFVPASILTLGAGFVYGLGWGGVYVLIAATIAGNLTFVIARHFARDWMSRKTASHPKFKSVDDAIARDGWKIVALIRLAPIFPFAFMSYAFGLTRIPWRHYFLANFAMIPGTMMYVYFGTVLNDLTQPVQKPPWVKWAVGAVTVIVVLYITRFAKRALTQRIS